jgi:hypothetical protein
MKRRTWLHRLGTAALTAVLAGGAYAALASDAVGPSVSGEGQGGIAGFVVSGVHYGVGPAVGRLDRVTFDISPIPSQVVVWFGGGSGQRYTTADGPAGDLATCSLSAVAAQTARVSCSIGETVGQVAALGVAATQ